MSFFGGCPSDAFHSDEEGDSEDFSNSSGSDSAEDDGMMRSYHIGSSHSSFNLGMSENTGLATIAEDVEEDSGGESSSGHWLFSADNTDTDSVIHVPPPLTLASTLPIQFENDIGLCHHSSSEETLVASEDEVIIISDTNVINEEIWKNMMKTSERKAKKCDKNEISKTLKENLVEMTDNKENDLKLVAKDVVARIPTTDISKNLAFDYLKKAPLVNFNQPFSTENVLEATTYSFDTSNIKLVNSLQPTSIATFKNINGTAESGSEKEFEQKPFSLMTNEVFENQIDDIFDFSSLDTCEEVSMSSYITEGSRNTKEGSSLAMEGDSVIFNTSATSEPFSDKKGKLSTDGRLSANGLGQTATANKMGSDMENILNGNEDANKVELRNVENEILDDGLFGKSLCGIAESVSSISYKESNSENTQKIVTSLNKENLNGNTYLDNITSKTHSVNDIQNRFSHSSSDEEMKSEADGHFTDLLVIQNSESPKNTISSLKEMETNGEALNSVLTNGENLNDASKLSLFTNGKGKQKRSCHRQNPRVRPRKVLRHSETSDGDTDDTDGDFEDDTRVYKKGKTKIIYSKSPSSDKAESENSAQLQIVSSFNEVPPSRAVGKDLHISASDNLEGGAIPSVAAEGSGINEQNTDFPINLNQCTTQQHKETNRNRVLLRPLSLGDLRYYSSDSETEEETSGTDNRTMAVKYNGVHPPFPRRQISSPSNISSTFDNLEEKKLVEKTSAHSNGPHRPRRHQSLYSPTSKQPISENGVRINSAFSYRRSVARPKPLSLDMAEEFLSQEGLKSPVRNYNPYAEKIQETFTREKTISSLTTKGGSANSDTLPFTKNQTGNNINILRRESHITTTSTPDLTDESPWLSAQKQPPRHPLLPDLPRYSGEPQLPLSSQASNVVLWPTARVNTPQSAPHSDDSSRLEHNKHILSMRAQVKEVVSAVPDPNLDMCERVNKNMKTFGANEEGEVYFEKNLKVQSPSKGTSEDVHSKHAGSRGVRFSPSVEEVPITYMEIDDSDYLFTQMEEKKVTKVKVVSSESPPLQKLTPKVTSFFSPPRDEQLGLIVNNITEVNKTDISNNKFQNQMNSDAKSVQNKDNVSTTFGNGNSSELSETPSLRRVPTPESPRSPTPIWQRLKLVKIGSPKGPRPKIPPKPPSLSPRSSDGETPRASSCSSPESGLSSPSSPEFKFKKIPTSPRFFSWGSKREKKEKDKNNKNSDRNSHPKEASAHPPQKSASLTSSSSPSPILDYPQVKRKETQVEGSYIINNSKERDETDDATRANLSTSLQSNYNANETELKKNSVKSRIFNGFHQKEKENENDFLKTRESILKQLKSARPTLNKVTKVEPSNSLNTSASPSTPSLSPSSDSDSILDDISSTHSDAKPPLPPSFQNRGGSQVLSKTRAHNVRRQYLTPNKQNATDINGNAQAKELTENTKEFVQPQLNATVLSPALDCAYRNRGKSASERLKERFERFSKATRAERERLARSTPDLSQIEESVRRLQPRIDWNGSGRSNPSPHSGSDGDATGLSSVVREEVRSTHRSSLRGGEAPYRNTFSRVSAEFDRISLRSRTRSVGLLETDLDTGASREVLSPQETNLDDLYQDLQNFLETLPQVPLLSSAPKEKTRAKSQSLRHLDAAFDPPQIMESNLTASRAEDSRAKSMEFLLDDNNRAAAQAPENELMKEGERKVSEAELRIRRSLQRLDVPEWMKTANTQQGFILRRRDHTMGATSGGWSAFSSKTGSMSSLGSSKTNTPITPTKVVIPTRMSTRSYGGITSPSSTASISPSPSDKGSLFTYPLSRWSTSRINSGTTTPTGSFTSQRTASYTRQPYLGWRSNTSLTSLGGSQSSLTTSAYLSPAERLALTILPNQQSQNALQKSNVVTMDSGVTSEGSPKQKFDRAQAADVHSSIKEVTSAIVHYCTETASPRLSPRASPNPSNRASSPRRRVWVESSFVGSRPITSPETPTSTPTPLTPPPINGHKEEMVVDTRPSHLTEEGFSFLNYFSGGSDIIHAGHKDHQLSSFIKSTETSIYDSSTILIDSRVESQNSSNEEDQFLLESQKHLRNDKCNQSENSSRHSTADTINSAISSREIDSLNSRNSGDSSMSRDSSASRHSSSGKEGSRDELPTYAGSCEEINDVTSEGLQVPLQNSNFLSLTDDSTLTASCHSSFGTFQIEEELIPKTPDAKPPTKLKLEVATSLSTTETRQSINSRRFSEGASPWEPSSYLKPFEKKSKKAEDEVDMDTISEGYGFNFSSYPKNDIPEADIQEAHTESTTLEDVLDSLLALPSASRSPSPSGGPHPLSLVRPCTPHSFLSNESSSTSKADSRDQDLDFKMDDSHFSYLRNHDFDPDFKTQSYHKSISYASSSFAPSSFSNQEKLEKHGSENPSSRSITSQDGDKTSVTFYLGKDEGEYTTTQSDALPAPNESLKVAGEFQNAIAKNEDCKHTYKHDDATKSLTKSVPNTAQVAHPFSAFSQLPLNSCFDKDWSNHSNPSNLLGFDSYRSSETVAGGSPMETDKPEKVVVAKEHKETKVTFRLPPKHMNIPPDSSSENENGSENFRVDMDDDDDAPSSSDPLGMTIHCRNHLCSNTATVEEARATYKTCHNCSVFYCSRECRRSHWEKHKKFCEKIRATTAAREIVDRVKEDSSVIEFMSSVARRGILSVGRGAVKIFFPDTSSAEKFVTDGHIHEAHYQALQNIMPQEMGSEIYKKLVQQCRSYNPEIKFILYVSICTFSETPTVSSHKFRRETVGKCAKLRLAEQNTQATISITTKPKSNHSEHHVITRDLNEPETLILTTVPEANYGLPPRQTREVAFSNIVRELQERGVNLRTQYADVYRKLAHYVDTGGSFPPLTIYPKDSRRGSSFMCIIMPEADPSRLERVGSNDSKVRTVDISRPHPAIS